MPKIDRRLLAWRKIDRDFGTPMPGDPREHPDAATFLRSRDVDARKLGIYMVAGIAHPESINIIAQKLDDSRYEVRGSAVNALKHLVTTKLLSYQPKVAAKLFEALHHDRSSLVRAEILEALDHPAFEGDQQVFELSTHLKKEPSNFLKTKIIERLGEADDEYAIRHLIPFTIHPNKDVRGKAVQALVKLNAPKALDYALELLKDKKSPIARQNGVRALVYFIDENPDAEKQKRALTALAEAFLKTGGKRQRWLHKDLDRELREFRFSNSELFEQLPQKLKSKLAEKLPEHTKEEFPF